MLLGRIIDPLKKKHFMELSVQASLANGIIAEQQLLYLEQYAAEMRLTEYPTEATMPLDELLDFIKEECTETELKIITFEIIALLLCDHEYDDLEAAFIDKLKVTFGFPDVWITKVMATVYEIIAVLKRVDDLMA